MMSKAQKDEMFMRRALELAEKGTGRTSPNPMVGAVVVRDGKIIGEGYHQMAGKPHAEIEALKGLGLSELVNATLYVTLEPCCHFGHTPPCTNYLIACGIKHVSVAMRDPNPLVSGKGIASLRKAGIRVHIGVLKKQAKKLNEVFITSITSPYPFVTLKRASTLDGKIATVGFESKWITNEKSRRHVHLMRNRVDAVITSSNTVIADDPHLGVRYIRGRDPRRIILDRHMKTSIRSKVYRDSNVLLVTTNLSPLSKRKLFQNAGIPLMVYKSRDINLHKLMKDLRKLDIVNVLIEAGSKLSAEFLKAGLVDKVAFFIAPKILGSGLDSFEDLNIRRLKNALLLRHVETTRFDDDILVTGYLPHIRI